MTSAKGLYDRAPLHETITGQVSERLTHNILATKGMTGRLISRTLEQDKFKREAAAKLSPEDAQMQRYFERLRRKAMDNIG